MTPAGRFRTESWLRARCVPVVICLFLAHPATASDGDDWPDGGRRAMSEAAQSRIEAVGQLRTSTSGAHCTATLIAPDLVLTAAHCVSSPKKGWVAPAWRVNFSAAVRKGQSLAQRIGAQLAVGQGYMAAMAIDSDLALVRLKDPIPADEIAPLPVASAADLRGRPLSVYSYGYDRPDILAEESPCRALAEFQQAMVTSCQAVGGVSGAPVVITDADGQRRVAAVVSSRLSGFDMPRGVGRAVVVPVDQEILAQLVARLSPPPEAMNQLRPGDPAFDDTP